GGNDRAAAQRPCPRLAPACAHGQLRRADAAPHPLSDETLHAPVLERVEADRRQLPARPQKLPRPRERAVELSELVVDHDAKRLKGALGRVAPREPRRGGYG